MMASQIKGCHNAMQCLPNESESLNICCTCRKRIGCCWRKFLKARKLKSEPRDRRRHGDTLFCAWRDVAWIVDGPILFAEFGLAVVETIDVVVDIAIVMTVIVHITALATKVTAARTSKATASTTGNVCWYSTADSCTKSDMYAVLKHHNYLWMRHLLQSRYRAPQ